MPVGIYDRTKSKPRPKKGRYVSCKICNKKFYRKPFWIKRNKNNFCSVECANIFKKGKPSYWAGKERPELSGKNHYRFNKHLSQKIKEKISETLKIHWQTHPHPKGMLGKHQSPETIKKRVDACKGEKNHKWKGGRYKTSNGYIMILKPEHPFPNQPHGYVFEHRLVVEQYLGRYFKPKEVCHHINKIRDDNRPENLIAFLNDSAHQRFHKNPNNVKPEEIIFDGRKILQ